MMGRKRLREDILQAARRPPPHISNVRNGDDGEIVFQYHFSKESISQSHELRLIALNVDEYPAGNSFMVFTNDENVSATIVDSFEVITSLTSGQTISQALHELVCGLNTALRHELQSSKDKIDGTKKVDRRDSSNEDLNGGIRFEGNRDGDIGHDGFKDDNWENYSDNNFDDDNDNGEDEEEEEDFDFGDRQSQATLNPVARNKKRSTGTGVSIKKLRSDLQLAKAAGFKVGILGDPSSSAIIVVSIRTRKLGISDEVMKAWQLHPEQYIVLLLRFTHGYESATDICGRTSLKGSTEIRVGLCASYKPDYDSAIEFFVHLKSNRPVDSQPPLGVIGTNKMQPLFIDQSLNSLLSERFALILKWREAENMSWCGAEKLIQDTQGSIGDLSFMQLEEYRHQIDDDSQRLLPRIVTTDSFHGAPLADCSLPLVAMQFTLRHFVRCTEFCLNCHCRVPESFAALKPYVCSKDLCLYQYMTLGFGPSIEWEITTQPYVVDLLISFCYIQAFGNRLRTFPTGIHLLVPVLPSYQTSTQSRTMYSARYITYTASDLDSSASSVTVEKDCSLSYRGDLNELLFSTEQQDVVHRFRSGQYLVLHSDNPMQTWTHHRIEEVLFPVVKLSKAISTRGSTCHEKSCVDIYTKVDCYLYRHDFDTLPNQFKQEAMMALLNTIPSVIDIRQWLLRHGHGENREVSLRQWRDGLIAPALDLLRWVIASNRSCIMQVDGNIAAEKGSNGIADEQRVSGMEDYMQFRFAQGAPDKEQRFIKAVNDHSTGVYPTIFAWHGSPIQNWHSIIREGLHFNETMHGRAYGHGVYMSPHVHTSRGYSTNYYGPSTSRDDSGQWVNSQLKPTNVLSLNEVVNNTSKFVSSTPHYVVAETDWIQTRYLFVQTSLERSKTYNNSNGVTQDPRHTAMGTDSKPIIIPTSAIPTSRRKSDKQISQDARRRKFGIFQENKEVIHIDDDSDSVCTVASDRRFLFDGDQSESEENSDIIMLDEAPDLFSPKKRPKLGDSPPEYNSMHGCLLDATKTDFRPGTLNMGNVHRLPPPENASRAATGALMKAYSALTKVQQTTPVHSLGWFVDAELENMYQWIVELHSFDKNLPLAIDMKEAGITSIVIEMRFTNEFPFQPPFVRVIKPRFLPFREGGGGHVTEGGAICMELLTNSGWSSVSSMENILLQIRMALSDAERPARLSAVRGGTHRRTFRSLDSTYSVGEAITAYERACRAHGWTIPPALSSMFRGEQSIR